MHEQCMHIDFCWSVYQTSGCYCQKYSVQFCLLKLCIPAATR